MIESTVIALALVAGILFQYIGYSPLLGYLLSGFIAGYLNFGNLEVLQAISDTGITLLLFTIGLKINLRELIKPQVWVAGSLQIVMITPIIVGLIWLYAYLVPSVELSSSIALWAVAFSLSFSSTVFAVKTFDERGENGSFHARITIGILVLQDLLAVIFLAAKTGMVPHWWAIGLVSLLFMRPLFIKLIDWCRHSELLTLCGIVFAFGASELFYACNIKGDLGALIIGAIISGGAKGNELYKKLIDFKDLFLVAFFVSVGYSGIPSLAMAGLAVLLAMIIPLRTAIYFLLFTRLDMRARTSMLASFGLSNYSEFGLIAVALAVSSNWLGPEWLSTIALALALSFFIATPFNTKIHSVYASWCQFLMRFELNKKLYSLNLQGAKVLVMGLGRVGTGAYQFLISQTNNKVLGVESLPTKVAQLQKEGFNAIQGDASDYEFWDKINLEEVSLILVSLTNHKENMDVVNMIHRQNYKGKLAVIARFPDEKKELTEKGCITFNLYAEAGYGFAEHVMEKLSATKPTSTT